MTISRIIGTESRKSARPIGSVVKSRLEPPTASRSIDQKELSTAAVDGVFAPVKAIKNYLKKVLSAHVACAKNIHLDRKIDPDGKQRAVWLAGGRFHSRRDYSTAAGIASKSKWKKVAERDR